MHPSQGHRPSADPIVLRPPLASWLVASLVLSTFLVATILTLLAEEWSFAAALCVCCVLLAGSLIELRQRRISLGGRNLTVVANFRERVIPRDSIDSVDWVRGVGVTLELETGRQLRLDGVCRTHKELLAIVRDWLNADP